MSDTTWLTQDAFDRLKAELEQLIANRPAVAAEINARREEGDLKENGGYHAAKDEQGKQEGRIRFLKDLLDKAQIGVPEFDGTVAAGTIVEVRIGGGSTRKFLLSSREGLDDNGLDIVSPDSPLGQAVAGLSDGQTGSFVTPSGASRDVEVISVVAGSY